jgi:CDP-glucose 4,6-dehydratase
MSDLSGKNILVTGGAGLVGSHVSEKLLAVGAKVFVLDIEFHKQSYFIVRELAKRVTVLEIDLVDFEKVKNAVAENKIDYIFHLGAQAIVTTAFEDPRRTFDSNVMGTVNILEAARQAGGVLGIVVASSDKAYGKDCLNAVESQKVFGDHPYDASKAATDMVAQTYFKTYGLPVAIARFGNIFGPGDIYFNRIIPGAMEAIVKNQELPIRSNGQFRRDYLYVKDVVEGYISLAENIGKIKGEAFNFSTNWNFSVIELLDKIGHAVGRQCKYKILNNEKNEIPAQSLNSEKAKKVLGWQPAYNIDEALSETYQWYKELLS